MDIRHIEKDIHTLQMIRKDCRPCSLGPGPGHLVCLMKEGETHKYRDDWFENGVSVNIEQLPPGTNPSIGGPALVAVSPPRYVCY